MWWVILVPVAIALFCGIKEKKNENGRKNAVEVVRLSVRPPLDSQLK